MPMSLEQARSTVLAETDRFIDSPLYLPSNVEVLIDFGPHGSAEHLGPEGSFEDLVTDADIYIHEDMSWDQFATRVFNQISSGDPKAYRKMNAATAAMGDHGDFTGRVARALFNSKVAVECLDVGKDSPFYGPIHELMPLSDEMEITYDLDLSDLEDITQNDVVSTFEQRGQDWALAVNYRDWLMATRFGPTIDQIVSTNPRLRQKDSVKVLMRLGGLHTNVFTRLREAAVDPDAVTAQSRLGEPVLTEFLSLVRANMLGVELSSEQIKRLCLRGIFTDTSRPVIAEQFKKPWNRMPYYERRKAQLRVSNKLSNDELWSILDAAHPTELTEQSQMKAFDLIARHVARTKIIKP